jgi:hypothetical protein
MYNTDLPDRAELPSTARLLRSTVAAALVAAALLVTAILPAEFGIDPTGVGRALGLAQMGEIKASLAASAHAGEAAPTTGARPAKPHVEESVAARPIAAGLPSTVPATGAATQRQDTVTVTLKHGQAAEFKLVMRKDASVRYEWSTAGVPVNYDTHGDPVDAPKDFYHGYGKGRNRTDDSGTLKAAFDGKHGWFWRNRSGTEVTITLRTSGEYEKIERVL